jgi:hypothetical protein
VSSFRRPQRLFAWIALVAMLALALLPTLSHAFAAARGDGVAGSGEICSADGTRRAAGNERAPASPASALDHFGQHCPFCARGGVDLAPPPAHRLAALTTAVDARPRLFWRAPALPFAWRSAAPRGPPAFAA